MERIDAKNDVTKTWLLDNWIGFLGVYLKDEISERNLELSVYKIYGELFKRLKIKRVSTDNLWIFNGDFP